MPDDSHADRCSCRDCVIQTVAAIREAAAEKGALALRVAQLETVIDSLIKHIDTWTHTAHRAYHGGPAGYFDCALPACSAAAQLVRQLERH